MVSASVVGGIVMKERSMSTAKEISTNISNVLSLSATCGNTRLKFSKISEAMLYLRVWSGKEGVDCEKVDQQAPSLDASLVSSHDVPAILLPRFG